MTARCGRNGPPRALEPTVEEALREQRRHVREKRIDMAYRLAMFVARDSEIDEVTREERVRDVVGTIRDLLDDARWP